MSDQGFARRLVRSEVLVNRRVNRSVLGVTLIILAGFLVLFTGPSIGLPTLVPTLVLVLGLVGLLASFVPNPHRALDYDIFYSFAIQIARLPRIWYNSCFPSRTKDPSNWPFVLSFPLSIYGLCDVCSSRLRIEGRGKRCYCPECGLELNTREYGRRVRLALSDYRRLVRKLENVNLYLRSAGK
jgi:hypothetical protein